MLPFILDNLKFEISIFLASSGSFPVKNDNIHSFFSLFWLQILNLPASLQNKNTRVGPFPWKRSVLQNPDRERTNQSTGICLRLSLPYNNCWYVVFQAGSMTVLLRISAIVFFIVPASTVKLPPDMSQGLYLNIPMIYSLLGSQKFHHNVLYPKICTLTLHTNPIIRLNKSSLLNTS